MSKFFDFAKMQEDIDKSNRGEQVDGIRVEGRNTDMVGPEMDNAIAADGIKETLGSSQTSSSASPQKMMAIAKAASKLGQSDVANMPAMKNDIQLAKPQDVMAARRQALMSLLKR